MEEQELQQDTTLNSFIQEPTERNNFTTAGSETVMDLGEISTELMGNPSGSIIRNVSIEPLNSGYLVRVGCQTAAVETTEKLVEVLGKYFNNPSQVEKEWFSKPNRNRLENIS